MPNGRDALVIVGLSPRQWIPGSGSHMDAQQQQQQQHMPSAMLYLNGWHPLLSAGVSGHGLLWFCAACCWHLPLYIGLGSHTCRLAQTACMPCAAAEPV